MLTNCVCVPPEIIGFHGDGLSAIIVFFFSLFFISHLVQYLYFHLFSL